MDARRLRQWAAGASLVTLGIATLGAAAVAEARWSSDTSQPGSALGSALLREAWDVVANVFYDEALSGVDPKRVIAEFAPEADAAPNRPALRDAINTSLARLGASHTHLYTPDDNAYFELLDIFSPDGLAEGQVAGLPAGPVTYLGVGWVTRRIEGRLFIADVYDSGPAHHAGLRVGDEILTVGGEAYRGLDSFRDHEDTPLEIRVRRAAGTEPRTITVRPTSIQPRSLYVRAIRASARLEDRDGIRLAYVRVRSYAHPTYHEAVEELLFGRFADADGLVLDLRGGWGGASPEYTNTFNPARPRLQMRARGREWGDVSQVWDRPVVIITDEGTRSGKEVLADALQRAGVATVVGSRSAGAVLGGRIFPLSDGSLLMVAVTDARVDGRRLEGRGVEPDVAAERPIPYCNGADPQAEMAFDVLARIIRHRRPV